MKNLAVLAATLMAIGLLGVTGEPRASGLTVQPGGLLIQDMPVGEARSIFESSGTKFVVYNRDSISHLYRISAHRPSEVGNGKWPRGYCEIPDASWIIPVPDVLEIPADSSASFDVVVELPADVRLYNQKWAAALAVESARVAGKNVALALYPALQIETRSSGSSDARPLGEVAAAPATLCANGGKESLSLEVYNNDSEPHDYLIHVIPSGGKIPPSPGLNPLAVRGLVTPQPERFRIGPEGEAHVILDLDPGVTDAEGLGPWEQLVFVESESGQCTFVRIQAAAD